MSEPTSLSPAIAGDACTVAGLLSRWNSPDGSAPEWLTRARRVAAGWAIERGFPTHKDEDWKYTPVAALVGAAFDATSPGVTGVVTAACVEEAGVAGSIARIAFVNGIFAPELSSLSNVPAGVTVSSLASELASQSQDLESFFSPASGEFAHAFEAINTAAARDGAVVRVAADTRVDGTIELLFCSDGSGTVSHPRSVIVVGRHSRVSLVENHIGIPGRTSRTNAVTQVVVGEGAQVDHYTIQDEPDIGFHLSLLDVRQRADSRFSTVSVALGSRIARHEVRVQLDGERAEATVNGLYLPGGDRHHDNPVRLVHSAPNCTSRQLYKGIASGQGHGVFNGHLVVLPGADGADASQTNKNLLLSEHAEIDTRPRLEILTDDVRCTHGAAVGALDPEAIFYLRSRGIPTEQAKSMLTAAFAREILDLIPIGGLRTHLEGLVSARLDEGATVEPRPDGRG